MDHTATEGTAALKPGERFTLEQWRNWPEGERWELIGGVAYSMCAAPKVPHQRLAGSMYVELYTFLKGKPCEALLSPVDVYLPGAVEDSTDTVVEPDVIVVCDPSKVQDDGVHGAPDLVIEVGSESTLYKDMTRKKALYERSGVREYWIVNPDSGSVLRYVLVDGRYSPATEILPGEPVHSAVLEGFSWTFTPAGA